LPNNENIVVLSACEISNGASASMVTQLYDRVEKREFTYKRNFKENLWYLQSKCVWNLGDKDDFIRHNNNGKNGKRVEQSSKHLKTRTVETVGH
jgi:hypothetical protein